MVSPWVAGALQGLEKGLAEKELAKEKDLKNLLAIRKLQREAASQKIIDQLKIETTKKIKKETEDKENIGKLITKSFGDRRKSLLEFEKFAKEKRKSADKFGKELVKEAKETVGIEGIIEDPTDEGTITEELDKQSERYVQTEQDFAKKLLQPFDSGLKQIQEQKSFLDLQEAGAKDDPSKFVTEEIKRRTTGSRDWEKNIGDPMVEAIRPLLMKYNVKTPTYAIYKEAEKAVKARQEALAGGKKKAQFNATWEAKKAVLKRTINPITGRLYTDAEAEQLLTEEFRKNQYANQKSKLEVALKETKLFFHGMTEKEKSMAYRMGFTPHKFQRLTAEDRQAISLLVKDESYKDAANKYLAMRDAKITSYMKEHRVGRPTAAAAIDKRFGFSVSEEGVITVTDKAEGRPVFKAIPNWLKEKKHPFTPTKLKEFYTKTIKDKTTGKTKQVIDTSKGLFGTLRDMQFGITGIFAKLGSDLRAQTMSRKDYDLVKAQWDHKLKNFRRLYIQYTQSLSKSKRTLTAERRKEIDKILAGIKQGDWRGSTTKAVATLQGIRESLKEDIQYANDILSNQDHEDSRLRPTKLQVNEAKAILGGVTRASRLIKEIGPVHLIKRPPKGKSIKGQVREFVTGKIPKLQLRPAPVLPEEGLGIKNKTKTKTKTKVDQPLIQRQ